MSKKKILIRIAAAFGILMSLVLLTLVFITLFLGDKIKAIALAQMNSQLATEVKVNGEINFSFFSHFPSASIDFNDVVIKETLPEKNDLLNCEKISLLFNVWNLLRSRYVIEKVTAENGRINIHVDSLGNQNYNIFRKSDNVSSDFSLKINKADLQDFSILYDDDKNLQHYAFKTVNSKLEGDFSSSKFSLSISADAFADFFKIGTIDFLPQRNLKVAGSIDCDLDKHLYTFRNAEISVNGNEFSVNGTVAVLDQGSNLQLKIASDQLRLEQIISLLPPEYASRLAQFTSAGNFNFKCEINGLQSAATTPMVNAQFHLADATISHNKVRKAFERVNVDGAFTNGELSNLNSSELSISKFSAFVDGNQIGGTLLVRDFKHPYIEVSLDGSIQLAKIYPLLQDSAIKSLDGIVDFHQCFFKGALTQLSSSLNMNKISAGGKFELHNVKLVTQQAAYEKLNGSFEIKNNNIIFSNCSFLAKTSDLKFEGTVSNLLPFILASFDRSSKLKQKIGLIVELTSHHLRWEDLVGQSNSTSPSSSGDDYSIPAIFYWLSGSASGTVDQFSYSKFNASNLHGKILFLPDKIYFNDIGLLAEQGTISCSGSLDISNTQHSKLQVTSQLDHIDITQLFSEFNNFDQATLTDKNLKGVLTASIALQSTWDDNRLNKSKLHAMAEVSVTNGELNNFEPMLALAKFMKLNELQHIRFSKMQNQVEIKNQRVYIPAMQIFSSALNVQLSGSHGFDNIIDYKLQLNLLHLLTDKFRKTNSNAGASDQTTEGFLNLYLTMTGPASNPVIKYDKKAVKQKIATDLAEEKGNLKDALKKEFNQQSASQQQAKDWKPQEGIQYFQFEDSTGTQSEPKKEKDISATRQNQKDALSDFKNIFKKPAPKK